MNAPVLQGLASVAGTITAIAINSLWEGALLVFCVWLLLRAWPGLNAATRYLVWSATLAAAVIVPIATTVPFLRGSPPPPSPTMVMANRTTAAASTIPMRTHAHTRVPHREPLAAQPRAAQTVSAQSPAATLHLPERFRLTLPLPFAYAIFAIWALLAVGSLARLAIGLFRLEQLKRDALPLPVEYRDAMERWAQANKGSRPVRLCVSDDIDVPVAVGLFDAMILIPGALLERLSQTEVDQISLHELAHLRRADDWSNGLQRIAIALLAWNPAVQFVGQQLDLEREVACDDWVLASTGLVRPYALCLTKMAETSSWPHHPMPAPGVFTTRKHISLRVERLLRAGRNAATNLSLGPAAATVAIVGALAFAMQLVAPSMAAPTEPAKHDAGTADMSQQMPSQPAKTKEIIRYVRVASNQTVAAREPATATTRSAVSTTASPMQVHIPPKTHVHIPEMRVHVPETLVHVPETLVRVPGQNIAIPPIDVKVPSAQALASATANSVDQMHVAQKTAASVAASVSAGLRSIDLADATSARSCNGCAMRGVDWSGRDMRGSNYTGVDLSHSKLERTNFSDATFNSVDFSHANLHGASFHNARLTGCDFSKADLTGVDFSGASITGCQFNDAQLPSTQLRSLLNTCTGCDFSRANLSGVDLSHVHTNGIDFSNANLAGANMSDSQFTGVDFSRARLEGANLTNTVFNGCDLSGVDLTHVDLSRAKLIGTDLSGRTSPHQ